MKKGKIGQIVGIGVLSALVIAFNVACALNKDTLNNFAYINTGTDSTQSTLEGTKLADQIEAEGAVLASNNGALPLDKTSVTKVNVFGWSSTQWVYSGSGSGRVNHIEKDLIDGLNDYGIETNTELQDFYTDFKSERPYMGKTQSGNEGSLTRWASEFSVLYEPAMDTYSDDLLANAEAYSDTAIVVLSRVTGESDDCPKVQYYVNEKDGSKQTDDTRTYLDISQDEEALLEYVTTTYTNTIVLVNSTNQMNLNFLASYDVDASLVTGPTGEVSAEEIPYLLYGEVNPSGRFADTYAYDFKSNPSYYTSGPEEKSTEQNCYSNSSNANLYPANGVTYGNVSESNVKYPGVYFVDYVEDIYIGYKWYETADAEGYFDDVDNIYGKGYDGVVQFPFGYGLSYTTFSENIESAVVENTNTIDATLTLKVKVQNTGSVKGKDVVEVYLTKPYTSGGIEKSAVELVAFGKTAELEPGADELVELTVKLRDFADYDDYDKNNNDFKGYELEKGDYVFTVRTDAHTIAEGDNTYTYTQADDLRIETDEVSGETISNKMLEGCSDGFAVDGSDSGQNITYLTRSDFAGTFPDETTEAPREMSAELMQSNKDQYSSTWTDTFDEEHEADYDADVSFGVDNGITLYDENGEITEDGLALGADFNDPLWEDVLDQVTETEAEALSLHGYTHLEAVDSVGKPKTREVDGPNQAGSFNVQTEALGYPAAMVLAQTWNKELCYNYGKQLGADAQNNGFDGLYAAGINLHRTPFNGRNYEYWSEDSFLTGTEASYEIKGGLNVGTYFFMKHFLNDEQETYRDGIYVWETEHNLRQNYLNAFKICIREGGLNGIMSSYNRVGSTWAGGSYALIHDLLETEMGYNGAILTDYSDHQVYMNGDQMLRAGGSVWMDGYANNGTYKYGTSSTVFRHALRNATKRNLYIGLNTQYIKSQYAQNGDGDTITVHRPTPIYWWTYVLYGVDALAVVGIGLWIFFLVRGIRKDNRAGEKKEENTSETKTE